jgi:Cyclin, N-terminal domain/Cyclin, C-terminal domain
MYRVISLPSVIGEFSFPREFAEITMSYVDRYLSRCMDNNPPSTKQEVELLALTCFYLTVKLHQTGPVLSARQMAVLSGGTYGIKEISAMEKQILFVLDWRLHPPCPTDFVCIFFALLATHEILSPCEPWEDQVLVLSRRMLESATLDYCFILHGALPSHLAAAALIYAVSLVQSEMWVPDTQEIIQALDEHSDFDMDEREIGWCLDRLRQICPSQPRVPVLTPDTSFDEDDDKAEEDKERHPVDSPNCVTTLRDFSGLATIPYFS